MTHSRRLFLLIVACTGIFFIVSGIRANAQETRGSIDQKSSSTTLAATILNRDRSLWIPMEGPSVEGLWNPMASGTIYDLWDVWGSSSNDVFAVGEHGIILHYDGSSWTSMTVPPTEGLYDIWGNSSNDVYAVGSDGTIVHYDGTSWTTMTSGTTRTLFSIWGSSCNDVFVVGGSGKILHYDGSSWTSMTSGDTSTLVGIWGITGSDVFAVGNGITLHYDGTEWTTMVNSYSNSGYLKGVWGSSSSDVFAVGDFVSVKIIHYDGNSWSSMSSILDDTGTRLWRVWGSNGSDIFAVGDHGTVLHYEGSVWSTMTSVTDKTLLGVWGSSGKDVFAVGTDGTIIHYGPTEPTVIRVPADYPTIQEAIDAAFNGDTVLVADGTYTGIGNKNLDFSGKAITVTSENGPFDCTIDCENDGRGFYFQSGETSNSVLSGFTVTNGSVGGMNGGGILCDSGSSPTIDNCNIYRNTAYTGAGVYCGPDSFANISACTIEENIASLNGGGVATVCSNAIERCTIRNNTAHWDAGGIHTGAFSPTITNCVISGNQSDENGGGICTGEFSSPKITNCTISDNTTNGTGGAIWAWNTNTFPELKNCILWNNTPDQIRGSGISVTYSDIYGGYAGTENIDLDPVFVDAANDSYYIRSGSPCIDKGTSIGAPSLDRAGTSRPQGAGFDMGAYEYDATVVELASFTAEGCCGSRVDSLEDSLGDRHSRVSFVAWLTGGWLL